MLEVDVKGIKARTLGDAHDFDAAHQPYRHRGDHLVALKLCFHGVA
jgi:hypothetical protein